MEIIRGLQKPPLNTQLDTVVYFIQRMDTDMLDTLLCDDYRYQDCDKDYFLYELLEPVFEIFRRAGNEWLEAYGGHCNSENCHFRCAGYQFRGNASRHRMDLIILSHEGQVTDIFECMHFRCTAAPFLPPTIRLTLEDLEEPF